MSLWKPGDLARVPRGGTVGDWSGYVRVIPTPLAAQPLDPPDYWVRMVAPPRVGFVAHLLVSLTPDELAYASMMDTDQ